METNERIVPPEDPDLSPLLALFLRVRSRFEANFRGMSQELGLSEAQFLVLQDVARHPRTRLLDLADRLAITSSACSKVVDTLVGADLLERSTQSDDRRTVAIRVGKNFDHSRFCDPALLSKVFPGFAEVGPEALTKVAEGLQALEVLLSPR